MEPFIHINEELIKKFSDSHPDMVTKSLIVQKLYEIVYDSDVELSLNESMMNSRERTDQETWKVAIAKMTTDMKLIDENGNFTSIILSPKELCDFMEMILANSQVYISCPVKINDTVWLIDKGDTNKPEIIECSIKIIRHIQTDNTSIPSFEALVEAKDENVHIRGYDENVMSMISMSGNYSTWVNKFMYEKYWFLSEEEAKKALSSMKK